MAGEGMRRPRSSPPASIAWSSRRWRPPACPCCRSSRRRRPSAAMGNWSSWTSVLSVRRSRTGSVPVVFGDVALDEVRGGTIISTEEIFAWLAVRLRPQRVILAGEVAGVLERPAARGPRPVRRRPTERQPRLRRQVGRRSSPRSPQPTSRRWPIGLRWAARVASTSPGGCWRRCKRWRRSSTGCRRLLWSTSSVDAR